MLFANGIGAETHLAALPTKILEKHEQRSKYGTDYIIKITPQTDLNGVESLWTNEATYDRLFVGGVACIHVWRGALPLRWYTVEECPRT